METRGRHQVACVLFFLFFGKPVCKPQKPFPTSSLSHTLPNPCQTILVARGYHFVFVESEVRLVSRKGCFACSSLISGLLINETVESG